MNDEDDPTMPARRAAREKARESARSLIESMTVTKYGHDFVTLSDVRAVVEVVIFDAIDAYITAARVEGDQQ